MISSGGAGKSNAKPSAEITFDSVLEELFRELYVGEDFRIVMAKNACGDSSFVEKLTPDDVDAMDPPLKGLARKVLLERVIPNIPKKREFMLLHPKSAVEAIAARACVPLVGIETSVALGKELFVALKAKDIPESLRLVGAGADINFTNPNSEYIEKNNFGIACENLLSEVALAMVSLPGFVVDEPDYAYICTPLMRASENGLTSVVAALLDKKASMNDTDEVHDTTALFKACQGKHADTALLLISAGADVNKGGDSPLSLPELNVPHMSKVKAALLARGAVVV